MKRILPFLLAVPFAAYAFACSSDSDDNDNTNNPGVDGGGNGDPNDPNNPGSDGGGGNVDESSINPTANVTVETAATVNAGQHGITWSAAENALFIAEPTSKNAFVLGAPDVNGKVVRVGVDGTLKGVFEGTLTTGAPFSVAVHPVTKKLVVVGTSQLFTLESADAGGGVQTTATPYATGFQANAASPEPTAAGTFQGLNDIVFKKDGQAFVSEPYYPNISPDPIDRPMRVYHISANGTAAFPVAKFDNAEHPNGLALSPDEKTLYVSITSPGFDPYGTVPVIWKYPVNDNGSLGEGTKFATVGTEPSNPTGGAKPDGLAVDKSGNLYVATLTGVAVFKPSGEQWGTIDTKGVQIASVAFGGADLKTLYIGASNDGNGTLMYKVAMKVTGHAK